MNNLSNTSSKKAKTIINLALLFGLFMLLFSMGKWVIPFLIALIISYTFHVPARLIAKTCRISNSTAAGVIVICLVSLCTFFAIFLVPLFKNALGIILEKLPKLLVTAPEKINALFGKVFTIFGVEETFDIGSKINKYIAEIASNLPNNIFNFINTGVTVVYVVMFVFMTPIITFYLLKDWSKIEKSFLSILKKVSSDSVISVISEINNKLGSYIKGQLAVCTLLSVIYILALFFIGCQEFLFCGFLSGLLSFAPFFGPFISCLTTLTISIDSFETSQHLITMLLYVLIPFIDSNFITPKLIGSKTGIQPFWILFSICATVSILGTAGIFISVPMAVVLSTICKEIVKKL